MSTRLLPTALVLQAAALLPSLLAFNVSPSATFLNQALAFALWGAATTVTMPRRTDGGIAPVAAALALLCIAAAWSGIGGALSSSLAISAVATLLAAAVLLAAGAGAAARADRVDVFAAFCWALLSAGIANVVIAVIQVFLPDLTDGNWIATSGLPGRAVGNLRQPNHLSSLLLWSLLGAVGLVQLRRLALRAGAMAVALLVFAVVLTASRTGLVSLVLLALWGVTDRGLSRGVRGLLMAGPLVYAVAWLGMAQWAEAAHQTFGGEHRLAESDLSSSRFGIWSNTLDLIRAQPWAGVGFGEFNFAWSLTPFPARPVAFFDHTHNLPLQLAVELGLPLATLVMALLVWGVGRSVRRAWRTPGDDGMSRRFATAAVLMIGLHSMLEYPLWYSYFLLPAAWAWGFALQGPARTAEDAGRPASASLSWAGLALMAGASLAVIDYVRVAAIFSTGAGGASLESRIQDGQRSLFFAHHAEYAAVTTGLSRRDPAHAFDRATHYLLDTRLMLAWARSLAEQQRLDEARHLAARLREFRNPDAAEFFAECPDGPLPPGSVPAPPFQCQAPSRELGWRAFLPR